MSAEIRTDTGMLRPVWTPAEAATLICPHLDEHACRGDRCMMWRWVRPSDPRKPGEHGYCGLAG